jgi:hypothetical protein
VVEAQQATAAAEARPVEGVQPTAPQQEPAAAEVRSEVVVEARQEPAFAGSSQATTVDIPDDDAPPPGWD